MALTCPKCDKTNNCECASCGAQENLVIIDYENDIYQCCHCGHKFDEQDSLDHDWDKMIKRFAQEITPQMCLDWISTTYGKDRKKLQEKFGEFGYEQAFWQHFGIRVKECNKEVLEKLRLQVNRDKTLDNLIDDTNLEM
jgi:hypothetical protein